MNSHQGLSGDSVVADNNYIIKTCHSDQARFLKNIDKQKNFRNSFINPVPILAQGITNHQNFIKMPKLDCENPLLWLSKASKHQIDQFIRLLPQYFASLLAQGCFREFDYQSWHQKLSSLADKIQDPYILQVLNMLLACKFTNLFNYGECHGDLTFSNLFIYSHQDQVKIDSIDFLSTFIESPLNDMVKLRQDTKHHFLLHLTDHKINYNNIIIILNKIDRSIDNFINKRPSLSEYYYPFQILNLIRILPYTQDDKIVSYLKLEIKDLTDEYQCHRSMRR